MKQSLTEDEVMALVEEWQKILRLEDWDLTVLLEHHTDMDGSLGGTRANPRRNVAKIRILKPSHELDDEDTKQTLVHELLHISSTGVHSRETGMLKGAKEIAMEGFVDRLATVLVRMKRAGELRYLEGRRDQIDSLTKRLRRGKLGVGEGKE